MAASGCESFDRSIGKTSDEVIEFPCTKCNGNIESDKFCVECGEYLCSDCLREHKRYTRVTPHRLENKDDFKSLGLVEKCSIHPSKTLYRYCSEHDQLCCGECMDYEHRSCTQSAYIPDSAKGISGSAELNGIIKATEAFLQELKQIQKTQDDDIDSLRVDLKKHTDKIRDTKQDLVKYLDELEQASVELLQRRHSMHINELEYKIGEVQAIISELYDTFASIDPSRNTNENGLFISMKVAKRNLVEAENQLIDINPSMESKRLDFDINPSLNKVNWIIKSFGDLRDVCMYRIVSANVHSIATDQDTHTCNVTGFCELDDGRVVIADWNNDCLKVLDTALRVSQSIQLTDKPFDVCLTENNELAITYTLSQKIIFVSLTSMTVSQQSIDVGNCCRGICWRCDKIYITCGGGTCDNEESGQVRIYRKTGELLSVVEFNDNNERIFTKPHRLMFNSYGTRIYVADETNGVVVLDRFGRFISTFKYMKLKGVEGLAKCSSGGILVCGSRSDNLIHFESNGASSSEVLGGRILGPSSLLWHKTTSKLLIGMQSNTCITAATLVRI